MLIFAQGSIQILFLFLSEECNISENQRFNCLWASWLVAGSVKIVTYFPQFEVFFSSFSRQYNSSKFNTLGLPYKFTCVYQTYTTCQYGRLKFFCIPSSKEAIIMLSSMQGTNLFLSYHIYMPLHYIMLYVNIFKYPYGKTISIY